MGDIFNKPTSPDRPITAATTDTAMVRSREVAETGDAQAIEGAARDFLVGQGLDPDAYTIRSVWQQADGTAAYSFRQTAPQAGVGGVLTDAELDQVLSARPTPFVANSADTRGRTVIVALGDMQWGKADGDGVAGTLRRTFNALDEARQRVEESLLSGGDIAQVVIAWMGDHIEGFNSQGGANAWRTPMALTEQLRVTRRTMLYAMKIFKELGLPLKMVAVPGNHGEAFRPMGKGVTRYDDNFDTEELIAVADAAALSLAYSDVEFYVPETDELSVGLNLSDTYVVFSHGHMSRGQHKLMEWVKGQAFNRQSIYAGCDIAFFGHYHSLYMETSSDRTVIVTPSLESESTWYRHKQGVTGSPGLVIAYVGGGRLDSMEVVHVE